MGRGVRHYTRGPEDQSQRARGPEGSGVGCEMPTAGSAATAVTCRLSFRNPIDRIVFETLSRLLSICSLLLLPVYLYALSVYARV
jgi:hypothetical protein